MSMSNIPELASHREDEDPDDENSMPKLVGLAKTDIASSISGNQPSNVLVKSNYTPTHINSQFSQKLSYKGNNSDWEAKNI